MKVLGSVFAAIVLAGVVSGCSPKPKEPMSASEVVAAAQMWERHGPGLQFQVRLGADGSLTPVGITFEEMSEGVQAALEQEGVSVERLQEAIDRFSSDPDFRAAFEDAWGARFDREPPLDEPNREALSGSTPRIPDGWQPAPENEKEPGEPGYRMVHLPSTVEMVYVPGGSFAMGGESVGLYFALGEKPVHEVAVPAFWIGRTEVTLAQWQQLMPGYPRDDANDGSASGPTAGQEPAPGDADSLDPVTHVDWAGSQSFCMAIGARLPTEAEWEYAARGPDGLAYPWGDEWSRGKCSIWEEREGRASAYPVESFPEDLSWCGAVDMAGNVAEWCEDWFDADYYERSPTWDPRGPDGPSDARARRSVRGGYFKADLDEHGAWARSSYRRNCSAGQGTDVAGFRVAMSAR